ncbi:MAG TPA: glycosyltransferase family 2 protein [Holophaga sp.]|nr:glycosyltransferase family 2 protein [Holophaga sp.]
MDHPLRLSLCIPTCDRVDLLPTALESALRELALVPEGSVELFVSNNGTLDGTDEVIAAFRERFPALRSSRFERNMGFDANYLHCMEQARAEHVWILGDDDALAPGALVRMLAELEPDPDAVLCAVLACDRQLRPGSAQGWFEDPRQPSATFRLRGPGDLAAYYDAVAYQAGAFAFVSAAVIRRRRFLEAAAPWRERAAGSAYVHVWGMAAFLQAPAVLRYVADPLVLNRVGNDNLAVDDPWARGMHDLRAWRAVAENVIADPGVRASFCGVLRRNHQDAMVRKMRMGAGDDARRWEEGREHLLAVGFDPVWIAACDLAYRIYAMDLGVSPRLDPQRLCVADLGLAALGARRAAVWIPGGMGPLLEASPLLDALDRSGRFERVLAVVAPGCDELLDGFEVLEVDPVAFARDRSRQQAVIGQMRAFAPGLLVNADPSRGLAGDLVAASLRPPLALAFQGLPQGVDADLAATLDRSYGAKVPVGTPLEAALGLPPGSRGFWPGPGAREEAALLLEQAGWDPALTCAVRGDDPALLAHPALAEHLAGLAAEGFRFVGLGERRAFTAMDALLAPFGDRALNLCGALGQGTVAALAALCREP